MTLSEQITQDMITTMKAKDAIKLSTLRMLSTAIKNEAINQKAEKLDDDSVTKIIKSEIKKRKDSATAYEEGGRADLVEAENNEIIILEKYLPVQMSEQDIEKKIDEILAGLPDEQKINFGTAMGAVMKGIGASADGNVVRNILQKKLN